MEVAVFRNLSSVYRSGKFEGRMAWAVVATSGPNKGKVIDTVDGAIIRDARFDVNETIRQKVLRRRKKDPHAYVVGELVKSYPIGTLAKETKGENLAPGKGATIPVSYNPFMAGHFFRMDNGAAVSGSSLVVMAPQGVYAVRPSPLRGLLGLGAVVETHGDWTYAPVDDWNG